MNLLMILGLLGGLGVGGYVAAFFFAPALAAVAAEYAAAFLKSRVGLAAVVLAGGLFVGSAVQAIYDHDACAAKLVSLNSAWKKKVDAAADAFAAARKARDKAAAIALRTRNDKRAADLADLEKDWPELFRAYQDGLKADPNCAVMTPEDVK